MANIALTTYCNLHCPYCFADKMITTEEIKNITIEQFKKTLKFIGPQIEKIGLIGGEPTLHPQFSEILQEIKNYTENCEFGTPYFVLFTNGIYLHKYLQDLPYNIGILINVNQPSAMTEEQYNNMVKNIKTLQRFGWFVLDDEGGSKATLGCNICQQIDDYSFIWNLVRELKIPKLRMAIVAPTNEEQKKNKELYYNSMKQKFLDFVNNAIKYDIKLTPDCSQIPPCYFTEEELTKINSVMIEGEFDYPKCSPVIDITPEFKASSCFGAYDPIDCNEFNDLDEIERYSILKVMCPKIMNNNDGKCKNCKKHELAQCQGGCLAFSGCH